MRTVAQCLTFPTSLLLAISTISVPSRAAQWPYNLPAHVKYYPEDEARVKRDLRVQEQLVSQTPAGVHKMSDDEGEMFFLDYWQFDDKDTMLQRRGQPTTNSNLGNYSAQTPLLPALPLHANAQLDSFPMPRFLNPRQIFARGFQCPTGTSSCASIGRPNACCGNSETCIFIADTGIGDVGCCPTGTTCGAGPSGCNTQEGYSSCPGSGNGGCCLPGYQCFDIGCIQSSTSTTTTTLPTATVTGSATGTTTSSTHLTSTSTHTTTSSSTTSSQSSSACSSGFRSCAASDGGGCCPTDRGCGPQTCPPLSSASTTTTQSGSAGAPVRPTSDSDTTSTPESTGLAGGGCPTGFYVCSAFYVAGCCRVGRDCNPTSCPPGSSTSIVSNGVTVVAPSGASVATNTAASTTIASGDQGSCAAGWYTCGASDGGGCCPSGFACGSSCTALPGASGTGLVQKINFAVTVSGNKWLGVLGITFVFLSFNFAW